MPEYVKQSKLFFVSRGYTFDFENFCSKIGNFLTEKFNEHATSEDLLELLIDTQKVVSDLDYNTFVTEWF